MTQPFNPNAFPPPPSGPPSLPPSEGMSLGKKVGIGFGVVFALLIGIGIGATDSEESSIVSTEEVTTTEALVEETTTTEEPTTTEPEPETTTTEEPTTTQREPEQEKDNGDLSPQDEENFNTVFLITTDTFLSQTSADQDDLCLSTKLVDVFTWASFMDDGLTDAEVDLLLTLTPGWTWEEYSLASAFTMYTICDTPTD